MTIKQLPTVEQGTYHKRQGGLWGQVFASCELERKLSRVEPLFAELHGRKLNRTKFFKQCHALAKEAKEDISGGYLQYMVQDIAGIMLQQLHRQLGKEVRRNRAIKREKNKSNSVVIEVGKINVQSWDLAKKKGGFPAGKYTRAELLNQAS